MNSIRSVAVLGAGVMGSRIAAHFANAGVPALLLDLTPDHARKGFEAARKGSPAALFTSAAASLVSLDGFDNGLPRIASADWVIEAVVEKLEIKQDLWSRVLAHAAPAAALATNTSGIPLARIAASFPAEARSRFCGAHFFNPPRYLHLLELIPLPDTDPALLARLEDFSDRRLGKGVVRCNDTPNFIANRIGSFFGATTAKLTMELDLTVEEVDALTGPVIGLPRSASFRLLDIVGIDVWDFVSRNLYDLVPHDPWRERFVSPPFLKQMIERGWLGDKTGQGFYKRTPTKEILAIDWKTLEYHPQQKPRLPALDNAKTIEDLPARLRALAADTSKAGKFVWGLYSDLFLYAAERIPEIAPRIVEIDRAMRWGYAHQLGPFEAWDALGFPDVCARIENEGRALPPAIEAMRRSGAQSFYQAAGENGRPRTLYFDIVATAPKPIEPRPGILSLSETKRARGVVEKNPGASLIDLGAGALCLELHSKLNTLGDDYINMVFRAIERLESDFEALVVAAEGEIFSAGANLALVLMAAIGEEWDELSAAVHRFQQAHMALKYAPKPTVVAPFSRALGGGCEIVLHAHRVQASAELYMGLVEIGVGLIPAAGGCKELIARLEDPRRVFELIGMAKVSTSADDARDLGLLDRSAGITMNPERLIHDARQLALSLASSYRPGKPRDDIKVGGDSAYAALRMGAWLMREAGQITEHEFTIAEKLARVLTGGNLTGEQLVSEQLLLDLEREAFLSLCGMPKTQERMKHMLDTGKPLRN
jgi:3-hydroxyacyl-CoA dehydrogenase